MNDAGQKEPRPLPGAAGRILAGNPFQDEAVTFRWFIAILIAAGTVVVAAKAFSATAAVVWGIVLLAVFGYGLVKVLIYLLSAPDDDQDDPEDPDQ